MFRRERKISWNGSSKGCTADSPRFAEARPIYVQHAHRLEIVTPEATVYSEDVEMVTLTGVAGQMGIFPQHVPLMTQMAPWKIIVHKDGHELLIARDERLIEIADNSSAEKQEGFVRTIHSLHNGLLSAQGDAVFVCLPADLQDPPELIPQFLEKWRAGYEVVYGVRKKREEPLYLPHLERSSLPSHS